MRRSWALLALTLALGACGGEPETNRFDLTTPGAHTGTLPASDDRKPVTAAEKRVIKGWSDSLRNGRVDAAVRYFSVPAYVSSDMSSQSFPLNDRKAVEDFNLALTCGSKLLETRRGVDNLVLGIFRLTERRTPGKPRCGQGVGAKAYVEFEIKDEHIVRWVAVDESAAEPTPTPSDGG